MKSAWGIFLAGCSMASAMGCGLDWTLPQAHFEGVDENGYVAYWEKIGEVDLGDGLVIPVNIGFNSSREASSPTLGKGWILPLLESHLEPIDENAMKVIMPDGWTFTFYRNGATQTWRGNSGWIGETKDTVFMATAPCGWRLKFDQGKIMEIDSDKSRVLSYRYNGGAATEIDEAYKVVMKVECETVPGVPSDIQIGAQKFEVGQAQRPQIAEKLGRNVIVGFDQSLHVLGRPDGTKETYTFGADAEINPTLVIARPGEPDRPLAWNAQSRQITTDADWTYRITSADGLGINRVNSKGQSEAYECDTSRGMISEMKDGVERVTTCFVASGPLSGRVRRIDEIRAGKKVEIYSASYDELGRKTRETFLNKVGQKKQVSYFYRPGTDYVVQDGRLRSVFKRRADGRVDEIIDLDLRSVITFTDAGDNLRLPLSDSELNKTMDMYKNWNNKL